MRISIVGLVVMKASAWRAELAEASRTGEAQGYTHGYEAGRAHEKTVTNGILARLLQENAALQKALKLNPRSRR